MLFGGSTRPFLVGTGFRLAAALGKKTACEAVRVPAGLASLAIGIMGAWAGGTLINFKITERGRLRNLAEAAPSATQLLRSSIPRAMFALPAEVMQLRRSAGLAATARQRLDRHGESLQHAVRRETRQALVGMPAANHPDAGPGIARHGPWLQTLEELLSATADVQQRARELLANLPQAMGRTHRSEVAPLA